ncbi:MAG: DUF1461 domain-containing protein [Clostridia bacterium]|nr:DUF1461 domain-containing protein [Clostridia bacterium]
MQKWLSRMTGFVLALSFAVLTLALIINILGTTAPLMNALMERFAPSGATGLPAEEYPAMAEMITSYLAGKAETFQYTWTDAQGVTYLAFRDYEQQHMADCLGLFRLCRRVGLISGLFFAACMGVSLMLRSRRHTAQGFLAGGAATLTVLAALAVWGLADFDGLFVLFHQLSFDNGLWLLNPDTDLLIRLMPIEFFTTYAAVLATGWLSVMLAALLTARRLYRLHR